MPATLGMSVALEPSHPRELDVFKARWPLSSTLAPELDKTSGDLELLSVDWATDEVASLGIPEEMKVNGWQLFWEHDLPEPNRLPTPLQPSAVSTTTYPITEAIPAPPATPSLPISIPTTRQLSADTDTGSDAFTSPDTVLNTPDTACHLPLPPAWSTTPPTAAQVHDTEAMTGMFYLMSPTPDDSSGAPADSSPSAASSNSILDQIELATHNSYGHPRPALELPDDLSARKESPVERPSNRYWAPRPQRKNPPYTTRLQRTETRPAAPGVRDDGTASSAGPAQMIPSSLSQRRSKLESEKRTREMYHLPPLPADDSEDELNIKPAKPALARPEQSARPPSPIHRAAWTRAQMHFPRPNERRPYTAKEDDLILRLVKSPQMSEKALQDIAAGLMKRGYKRTTSAIKFRLRNTMNERFREKFGQLERPFVHAQGNALVSEDAKGAPSQIPKTRLGKKRRLRKDL